MDFEILKKQAEIFKSISHETRLAILHILENGDKCVNEIVKELNEKERTGISKHLTVLKYNNLISVKEEGTKRIYHLECPCLLNAVQCTMDIINPVKVCK